MLLLRTPGPGGGDDPGMTDQSGTPAPPRRYTRRPVRWRWPVAASALGGCAAGAFLPLVAFGTSYCPGDGPDPRAVWLLRTAYALTGLAFALPFAVAAGVDVHRGAPDAARRKAWVAVALTLLGLLAAAGAEPSTWCF